MILYRHKGEVYAFCGDFCLHAFQRLQEGDSTLFPVTEPDPGVTFGCWWCGADVTIGLQIAWLENAKSG
jgi:hypothetical protein